MNTAQLQTFCTEVRRDIINMTANAGSGHPGGSLSAVELMSAIFCTQMRIDPKNPKDPDRDRFVLSKGHAAPCYYGILAELGFFSKDEFKTFRQLHGMLQGHPDMKKIPGVDASTGSLARAFPSPWAWPWGPSTWGRTPGSTPSWGTASARRARCGRPLWRPTTISWTTSPWSLTTTACRSTGPTTRS